MNNRRLILGSRSSKLALAQANLIGRMLEAAHPGLEITLKLIKTTGDKMPAAALHRTGGKGLFTREIEDALLAGTIDAAVHSMKDLPVRLPEGLKITAVTKREDPRDVLVSRGRFTLKTLPVNSSVGTGSLRRRAQLLGVRKDLRILELRGNVDTRVGKLNGGAFDAIIIAAAGLKRLGLETGFTPISADEFLPQAGQGALGIEIRSGDSRTEELAGILDDPRTALCVRAERGLLSGLNGGCHTPIGAYAVIPRDRLLLKAGVFSPDGTIALRDEIEGGRHAAEELGRRLAARLLAAGAGKLLEGAR